MIHALVAHACGPGPVDVVDDIFSKDTAAGFGVYVTQAKREDPRTARQHIGVILWP